VVYLSRSTRAKTNLKVRQPLKRVIVSVHSQQDREDIVKMERVILEEINVKALEFVTDESGLVNKKAKPNFKSIGPKYGKNVQAVAQRIRDFTTDEILQLERQGVYDIRVNGTAFSISKEDIEITTEDIKGWVVESDGVVTVALDTELTDELRAEGLARELVNRIQNMRKDSGFQVTDRIRILYHSDDPMLGKTVSSFGEYIKLETLAEEMIEDTGRETTMQAVVLNGIQCMLAVELIANG
jgi:isoleucyl-tRNA synthetase